MGRVSQSMQEAAVVTNINETAENTKWPLETPRPKAPDKDTFVIYMLAAIPVRTSNERPLFISPSFGSCT